MQVEFCTLLQSWTHLPLTLCGGDFVKVHCHTIGMGVHSQQNRQRDNGHSDVMMFLPKRWLAVTVAFSTLDEKLPSSQHCSKIELFLYILYYYIYIHIHTFIYTYVFVRTHCICGIFPNDSRVNERLKALDGVA